MGRCDGCSTAASSAEPALHVQYGRGGNIENNDRGNVTPWCTSRLEWVYVTIFIENHEFDFISADNMASKFNVSF